LITTKNIDKKIASYVIIGGILGSITGAFLVGLISALCLAVLFVTISILTIFGIYLDRIIPKFYQKIKPYPSIIVVGSFLLNFITGMRGGSGGSLFPSFLKTMKLNIHKAVATSLFVTIFTAIAAIPIYWHRGNIIWMPALFILIGSMIGARLGSKVSLGTKPKWLKIGLSVFVIILAFVVIYKAL
jgi:uncharacterized membrane protein YfcA